MNLYVGWIPRSRITGRSKWLIRTAPLPSTRFSLIGSPTSICVYFPYSPVNGYIIKLGVMFANLKWFHCEALIWIDLYEWRCKFSHTYFICISPSVHFLFITFVQLDCWAFLNFFFFFFLIVFKAIIYFFLATMGLRCSASSFSSCSERELLSLWCLASEADSYPVPPGKSFSISETPETVKRLASLWFRLQTFP